MCCFRLKHILGNACSFRADLSETAKVSPHKGPKRVRSMSKASVWQVTVAPNRDRAAVSNTIDQQDTNRSSDPSGLSEDTRNLLSQAFPSSVLDVGIRTDELELPFMPASYSAGTAKMSMKHAFIYFVCKIKLNIFWIL